MACKPIADDGDPVKGLGFVAMYAAHVEADIDECLEFAISGCANATAMRKWPTSRKIVHIRAWLGAFGELPEELAYLPEHLSCVRDLLEKRNTAIHGRLEVDALTRRLVRKSGREGVADEYVESSDLYDLANEIFALREGLLYAWRFSIPRLVSSKAEPTD